MFRASLVAAIALSTLVCPLTAAEAPAPAKTVIPLDITPADDSAGGMIVADVNNDGKMEFLVTAPGRLVVYSNDGRLLWGKDCPIGVGGQAESQGLPGHNGPGVAAGDVDGDGACEVVFLTKDSVVHIVDGKTGQEKATAKPPVPDKAERWEVAMIADFHGNVGDTDLLLQATNKDGYRMGKYLAAYAVKDLVAGKPPLWTTDTYLGCAHNSARLADINGDGRDEVLGATVLAADGTLLTKAATFGGHIDSIFVADVRPELPGLELVLLEEGRKNSDRVQVLSHMGPVWRNHFNTQEPQNAAVGRFAADSDEVFVWCRSRYNEHQKPFVFNSLGEMVFDYKMDDVAPKGWTASGVEVIHTIDWTGQRQQLACAKERHTSGDVGLYEPLTGQFVLRLPEKCDRLYVADVFGDWREEIVVLAGTELHVYQNTAANPRPTEPSKWTDRNYRRLKQCHNYYSP